MTSPNQGLLSKINDILSSEEETVQTLCDKDYAFRKYPILETLFNSYKTWSSKYVRATERWEPLVREVQAFGADDVRYDLHYMYKRILLLSKRLDADPRDYFFMNTDQGTYRIPDRLALLNRLFTLYSELVDDIYPAIYRKLTFETSPNEIRGSTPAGRIDWGKTTLLAVTQGNRYPIEFHSSTPQFSFDSPENILLMLSISSLENDSQILLQTRFSEPLNYEERSILNKVSSAFSNVLDSTILSGLLPMVSKYKSLKGEDHRVLSLENETLLRTQDNPVAMQHYSRLANWRRKYRELDIRSIASSNLTNFPIDRTENLDQMFEYWILFELLNHMVEKNGARTKMKLNGSTPRVEMNISGKNLTIYHQKTYNYPNESWALASEPDFTVEVDGELKVVMDAKNWREKNQGEAMYKMLGYLNNLDANRGVLFFSSGRNSSQEAYQIFKATNLKFHKDQILYNCLLEPSEDATNLSQKNENLTKAAQIILESL